MLGDATQAKLRLEAEKGIASLDGGNEEVEVLAKKLVAAHAVPATEVTDAYHIATAAVRLYEGGSR